MTQKLTNLFPFWAILFSILAFYQPHWFAHLKPAIVPLLGVVMFSMGMTLTAHEFQAVMQRPATILLGTAMQFGLMPLIAWGIARAVGLSPALAAGLIVVGCCPGGTASNVITYLAKGDVALSITLTAVSTVLAVVATPWLTWLYIGQLIPVPVASMLVSVAKIVLLPVAAGIIVNTVWGKTLAGVKHVFPLFSVAAIVAIIAIIVALNRAELTTVGLSVIGCVILHNLLGLMSGYTLAKSFRLDERAARTLAIEVGMQNSGLGVALAVQYFSALAALPGAIFSIWHNVSGAYLAAYWSKRRST